MTQDRASYQKDLAAILKKAQGRVDAESGEPIHVGAEVVRLRDTLAQLSKAAKASEASPGDYTEGRKRLHEYLDENHGVIPLTDDLSEIERIVLSYAGKVSEAAQQAEAEPVAWQYRFVDPISGSPIWRHGSGPWNAQKPKEARPLYTTPPAPSTATVVPEPEGGVAGVRYSGEV